MRPSRLGRRIYVYSIILVCLFSRNTLCVGNFPLSACVDSFKSALICLTRRLKSVAISSPLQIFLPSLLDKVSSHCCILLEFAYLLISAFQRLSNSIFPCSLFCSSLRNGDIDTVSRGKTAVLLDFGQIAIFFLKFHSQKALTGPKSAT